MSWFVQRCFQTSSVRGMEMDVHMVQSEKPQRQGQDTGWYLPASHNASYCDVQRSGAHVWVDYVLRFVCVRRWAGCCVCVCGNADFHMKLHWNIQTWTRGRLNRWCHLSVLSVWSLCGHGLDNLRNHVCFVPNKCLHFRNFPLGAVSAHSNSVCQVHYRDVAEVWHTSLNI